jgi:cytochrome c-type biogenesis protein
MADSALALQILIAFGGGVISFLSPCVLPLLPGYLSMMSGYSVSEIEEGGASTRRLVRVVLLFIGGFTLVFAAFGATASSIGRFLAANLPTASRIAGGVVIVFGLLMVALAISQRGPLAVLSRDARPQVRPSRLGSWAPPVMGAAFAFGWTPCIGPVLGAILAIAAGEDSVSQGVSLLLVYSLGLGIPFVLAALAIKPFMRAMQRFRGHLASVEKVMGGLLVLTGILFITNSMTLIAAWMLEAFPGLATIG